MKTTLFYSVLLFAFFSCQNKQSDPKTPTPNPEAAPAPDNNTGKYIMLKGKLDTMSVTMHLIKQPATAVEENYDYSGQYYYAKHEQPIALYGNLDSLGNLVLEEASAGETVNAFTGKLDASGSFTGVWASSKGKSSLPVSLQASTPAVQFDVVQFTDVLKHWPNASKSPTADYSHQMLVAKSPADAADFLNSAILKDYFGDSIVNLYKGLTQKQIFDKQRDEFFAGFKDALKEDAPDSSDQDGYILNYSEDANMVVYYNEAPYVSLGYQTYAYTGGAHGSCGTMLGSYDLNRKKKLALNDVLKPGFEKSVNAAIATAIRKHFNISAKAPLSEVLFDDTVKYNENFCITRKGITFLYNQYEIAAYAMGQIPAFIPFESIKAHVQPEFLK
jgi:hypothetical protein